MKQDLIFILPLIINSIIFIIGIAGMIIHRHNLLRYLLCGQLSIFAIIGNFIYFTNLHHHINGLMFLVFFLTFVLAELLIGFYFIVTYHQKYQSLSPDHQSLTL